jgi:hypothetical protein
MEKKESGTSSKPTTTRTRKSRKAEGLGDVVEAITTATGIKAAVDWFSEKTGIDCGCDARKEKLNKLVRFSRVECLTKEEYDWLSHYFSLNGDTLSTREQDMIANIHARIFNHKVFKPCTCSPSRWRQYIEELRVVYNEYKQDEN